MVERLTQRAKLPMPRIFLCPQAAPNAFATGRGPSHAAIGVTRGMLEFPREELEGVLAHELGHVKHRDMLISTIAAVMAGVISYAGYMFMFFGGGDSRNNPFGAIGALLMLLLAPAGGGADQNGDFAAARIRGGQFWRRAERRPAETGQRARPPGRTATTAYQRTRIRRFTGCTSCSR